MTPAKYVFLLSLVSSSVLAQQLSHPVMVSRDDAFSSRRPFKIITDTIDVLAVMVQFQQDNTPLTSGDGRFDLIQGPDPIIDAPPHNKQYFLDHFTFVANYFRKSSKGKVVIRTTVLDSIITLPRVMQEYSPPRTGSTIAVGNLARDTWQKVDSAGLVPDFSRYECFIVLHAGIGRDIDLISLLGYDPTPYDIPSLYIGLNGFRQFYGTGYQGISVNGGSFRITNSIIIGESESRTVPTVTGTALLELSINGLLCASVGNYLGLPDLFDTNTGKSGIGRFGLMDGQAIFSFKGVFPPEPSAWEKYWLGWIEPITLQAGPQTVALPAVGIATASGNFSIRDTVYRVPISAQEYFLVENRNRDPNGGNPQFIGQKVLSTFRGASRVQTFPRDTVGFNAFDLDSLAGVVTDVEDLDWSLPGGVSQDGTFFDGGVLIWHIDEAVIAQGLQTNGVNGNPLRRGVDLEEADGSQDIGQSYEFLSPGSGSEEGTALDFWYPGNSSPVNHNVFSPTSYPDSRSNSGANSHITISDFSTRGPRMTAKVKLGDESVTLLAGFPKQVSLQLTMPSLTVAPVGSPSSLAIVVATTKTGSLRPSRSQFTTAGLNGEMYAWKVDGSPILPRELFALSGGPAPSSGPPFVGAPVIADINADSVSEVIVADARADGGLFHVYQSVPRTLDSLALELFRLPLYQRPSTSPLITDSVIAIGASRATVYLIARDGNRIDSIAIPGDSSDVVGIASANSPNGFIFTTASGKIATNLAFTSSSSQLNLDRPVAGPPVVGRLGGGNQLVVVCATANGLVYAFGIGDGFPQLPGFPVNTGANISNPPALADIDGDGIRDIVVFAGNKICVYNHAGASLDNFPKSVLSSKPITSHPVVADVDGDGDVDIVAVTGDGLVVAYDKDGTLARGFPLQAGTGNQSVASFTYSPPVSQAAQIGMVVASSDDGAVSGWWTGAVGPVVQGLRGSTWLQYQNDARHTGLSTEPISGTPLSSEFFPKSRAYNWPNPVYDGKTFIRYFVKDNATVNVKVFDLAGDLVTTIANAPGVGGVDNEIEWNVADVQSGIYFARIEANGAGGNGVAVVKIAVVK
jgi:hypothetical protein